MTDKFDGSITITTGNNLSKLSHEEFMSGLAGIQSALEKGLPAGMKEVMGVDSKLFKNTQMATGTKLPMSVIFAELKRREKEAKEEREEAKHNELVELQKQILAKTKRQSVDAAQVGTLKPEKPKQKGRYRLTDDEIKKRKKIVKEAIRIKNESPLKTWEQVAIEIDVPDRTLRDWRHNF